MKTPEDLPFYVGYRTDNPEDQSCFTRRVVTIVACMAMIIGAALTLLMQPFDEGVFEFGSERTLTGRIETDGQPRLLLDSPLERPRGVEPGDPYAELLLVRLGKFGAHALVADLGGTRVEAKGTLIAQGSTAMLELSAAPTPINAPTPATATPATATPASATPATAPRSTGAETRRVSLVGEIVDTKCFLGAMKPGRGKSHRSCAALCLEGGVPPAFLVRPEPSGSGSAINEEHWIALLLDAHGQPITTSLAPFVGYPVRIDGYLEHHGAATTPRLLIDPQSITPAAE